MNATFESSELNNGMNFEAWLVKIEIRSLLFQSWSVAFKMEIDYLIFLRSIKSYFQPYISSIGRSLPWIFALDHVHYAH